MDGKTLISVSLLSLIVSCSGQLDMGGMGGMEGMAGMGGGMEMMMGGGLGGGLDGGLGAGLGGAMGGSGGASDSGIPGMARINSLIGTLTSMSGGGGGGGGAGGMMGPMVGMMVKPMIIEIVSYFKMAEVAKAVLGPHAHPDDKMINYAKSQGKQPSSMSDMLPYMTMLVELSKKIGIYMPDDTIKKPLPDNVVVGASGGKTGSSRPTLDEVRNMVLKRSLVWFQASKGPPPGAGTGAAIPKTTFVL